MSSSGPIRRLRLTRGVVASLLDAHTHAQQSVARVQPCGVLVAHIDPSQPVTMTLVEVVPCTNRHERPTRAYRVDAEEATAARERAEATDREVVGLWTVNLSSTPMPREHDLEALRALGHGHAQQPSISVIVGAGTGRSPVIRAYAWESGAAEELSLVT